MIVFENRRDGTFRDVSAGSGAAVNVARVSRGLAMGDLFHTGRMDLIVENLAGSPVILEAKPDPSHHWVSFELEGAPRNRLALNARVRVTTGKLQQLREVRSGGSYLSQNELHLHFGLGVSDHIDKVDVTWSDGQTQSFTAVAVDRLYHLKQGGVPTPVKDAPVKR